MHLPNSTVKKFCPEEDGWYATVPTPRLAGTTIPCVPRLAHPCERPTSSRSFSPSRILTRPAGMTRHYIAKIAPYLPCETFRRSAHGCRL